MPTVAISAPIGPAPMTTTLSSDDQDLVAFPEPRPPPHIVDRDRDRDLLDERSVAQRSPGAVFRMCLPARANLDQVVAKHNTYAERCLDSIQHSLSLSLSNKGALSDDTTADASHPKAS